MSHFSGNIDDFGMDSVSLAGTLEARLKSVREAGFTQIMLGARDLVGHPDGVQRALAVVRASGLRVTGFQALSDFEGLAGQLHDYKTDIAKSALEMCQALGCRLLLIRSSTFRHASSDTQSLARDLRKLSMLAIPMNIRIAYEAWSEGNSIKEFGQAWDMVCQADMPNLGLALGFDTFYQFAFGTLVDELDILDPDKIFLVQLADFMGSAPHFRVFPGEGAHSKALAGFVTELHRLGYRGAYYFDVFNVDYQQMPSPWVAERARRAAVWLGEGVLQRSVPLPNHMRLRRSGAGQI